MHKQEAVWLSQFIYSKPPAEVFPMLDLGSCTEQYRKVTQPWIDELIFAHARQQGLKVVHSDILNDPGVDLVGDLTDSAFLERLAGLRFQLVLCGNMLYMVPNLAQVCQTMESAVVPGGFIMLTNAYKYPLITPLDTGWRPSPREMAALFPNCRQVASDVLCVGRRVRVTLRGPRPLAQLVGAFVPYAGAGNWRMDRSWLAWLFRVKKVSCLILQKQA